MSTLTDHETHVMAESDQPTDRTPDWCPAFRLIYEHLRQQGHLGRLDELVKLERRAGSFGLREVALFFIAYFCANPSEGGLRGFWYQLREVQEKLAPMVGLSCFPSSSSISRYLAHVTSEELDELCRFLFGPGSALGGLAAREQAMWLDTHQDPWLIIDWDPKGRMIRQRTLIESEEHPDSRRYGPNLGALGRAGRKRGELKLTRGLFNISGSGMWVGAYHQPGNGHMVDALDVVADVGESLRSQLPEELHDKMVMRVDGEGGEVPIIRGIRRAGFVPLVRLKQYALLERSDVWEAIENQKPKLALGTGTGPRREVFEIGLIPLTSGRKVDKISELDKATSIRLVVSRYRQTEADQGSGKLIDGWRYELFGTDLCPAAWPCDGVVELYFGRSTIENRLAGADREVHLDQIFCQTQAAGQHLVSAIGLWIWNLMIELGDRLVEPEQAPTAQQRPNVQQEAAKEDEVPCQKSELEGDAVAEANENLTTLLSASVRARLAADQMTYDEMLGVILCGAGHYLVPKRRDGPRDEETVAFRITGHPCRGCSLRSMCTTSTRPNFRKEYTLPAKEVPRAIEIRAGKRRAPIGVQPIESTQPGSHQIRRPTMLPAQRRQAFKQATQKMELRVRVEGEIRSNLAENAQEHNRHQRTRQRLSYAVRRRYHRLNPDAHVTLFWDRGVEATRRLMGVKP